MVGASGVVEYNHEEELMGYKKSTKQRCMQISGKPQWEGYEGGKKYQQQTS